MAVGDIYVHQGDYEVETSNGRESAPNQRAARARAFELSGGQPVMQHNMRATGRYFTTAAHPTVSESAALTATPRGTFARGAGSASSSNPDRLTAAERRSQALGARTSGGPTAATASGGQINRVDAAERMFGTGSPQHRAAIARFGPSPRTAGPASSSGTGNS